MGTVIVFDLETTGLESDCDIISIGAIAVNWEDGKELDEGRFEVHIVPTTPIKPGASKVNGFTKEGGRLYKNGILVENSKRPQEGLQKFIDYICRQAMARDGQIDLIAHNAFEFDGPRLSNNIKKFGVQPATSIR